MSASPFPITSIQNSPFVRGEDGVLRLAHRGARVTTEMVRQLMDEEGV
jgi:hypothetical protein